ncbi:MAG: ribbon-helix-helix protein, CopG family [Verrucomicrobia bacterium]|nr:ribbon-helix-helix protein, CopG family [Verrucomicrobiota bacterium]
MKTLTVRLPEKLVAEIEAESQLRRVSKSGVIRDRLQNGPTGVNRKTSSTLDLISDLIGSVEGLPPDLSARKKKYLKVSG